MIMSDTPERKTEKLSTKASYTSKKPKEGTALWLFQSVPKQDSKKLEKNNDTTKTPSFN